MRGVRAALHYAKPVKMKRREGDQPGSPCARGRNEDLARWSLVLAQRPHQKGENDTHIVPVLPERARGTNSDLQIVGGAPSTGAVGTTCVPFLDGKKLAWKDHV
jgi:hypothetical protein